MKSMMSEECGKMKDLRKRPEMAVSKDLFMVGEM